MNRTDETNTTGGELIITRTFDAPRTLVWQAWTEAERLLHWWGPKGVTMKVANVDLRPGGSLHYCYEMANGNVMWGLFNYHEIVAPERLVFTSGFSDEQGNLTRNPWAPVWPLEILNVYNFTEENGKTTIHMRGLPYNATDEEQKAFAGATSMIQQGFKGTLDQLAEYLASVQ
jgi:uncharacterized protein YndB with AHSA1/START domain